MEYTLHKLSEGFVITSDETPKNNDLSLHPNGTIGIIETALAIAIFKQTNEGSYLEDCKKVIAQQDQIDFSALSEEEQKEIGWFDAEKIFCKWFCSEDEKEYLIKGFQIAQELLSGRRFTLEDMKRSWREGIKPMRLNAHRDGTEFNFFEDFIEHMYQPKSWKIELEMEDYIEEETGYEFKWINKKLKFTNGKIKILKLL